MQHLKMLTVGYFLFCTVDASIEILNIASKVRDIIPNREATTLESSIVGYIEYADPPEACTSIAPPVYKPTWPHKNMVLIDGSSICGFFQKIENAKAVGYEAAVLFDPFPGPFNYSNISFPILISEVNITVVLVSCEDGIKIREKYLYRQDSSWDNMSLLISPISYDKAFAYGLMVCLGLAGAFILCFVIFAVSECIKGRFENSRRIEPEIGETYNEAEPNERALSNLRRRLPIKKFSLDDSFDVCAICCNDFKVGEKYRVLNCSHAFHADCIDKWLLKSRNTKMCPLCKNDVDLENSVEMLSENVSESTPLLSVADGPSSSNLHSGPSNTNKLRYNIAEALGSINARQPNQSEKDTQPLIV